MPDESTSLNPKSLLRKQAADERRLLKKEHIAERAVLQAQTRLASAIAKRDKAQARVERRQAKLEKAVNVLRDAQTARATGPAAEDQPTSDVSEGEAPIETAQVVESAASELLRDDSAKPTPSPQPVRSDDDEPSEPRPTRRRRKAATSALDQIGADPES